MNSERLELICQQCGGVLHLGTDEARCEKGHGYLLVLGRILDVVADKEGSTNVEELRLAATMSLAFEQATYAELLVLLDRHYSEAPDHLRSVYTDYVRSAISRNRRMVLAFRTQALQWYDLTPDGSALELGCGFGGSFPVLSRLYKRVAGIEPSLPRLIIAAKLLDEHNIHNVQLVRAYAQHVPFRDSSFDYVTAINVMEHVLDVEGVMNEVHRLLRSGSVFLSDSRNRYDLFLWNPM
jgi:SAM-dependent methyltransferase